jgi:hypothetical protein
MYNLQTAETAQQQTASDEPNAARQDSPLNIVNGLKSRKAPLPLSMNARQIHRDVFGTSPSPSNSNTSQDGDISATNDTTTAATAHKREGQVAYETEDRSVVIELEAPRNLQPTSIPTDSAAQAEDINVQEPLAASTAPATTTQAEDDVGQESEETSVAMAPAQGIMAPPTAPASMLPSIQPSARALNNPITDLSAILPLVSICVILFRQGRADEAKKLGQYTVDIAGQQHWDTELPIYLASERLEMDKKLPLRVLKDTLSALKALNASDEPSAASSAAFLEGMLYAWGWI